MKEYALYKGDILLGIGTINKLAKKLNVLPNTIRYYSYPIYSKKGKGQLSRTRKILIPLD